jgi:ubiquinone/menaquinone biosynthesis C-methylase UbiE
MRQNWEDIYKKSASFNIRRIRLHIPSLDLRGKYVLDIGCWWGWFMRYAQDHGALVSGFDRGKSRIADAIEFLHDSKGLCVASAEQIPYKTRTFDIAFSYHVMEHVQSDIDMLREINRILIKNGNLILAVPNDFSISVLPFRPFRWFLKHEDELLKKYHIFNWLKSITYSDIDHCKEYTRTSLRTLLEASHFKVISIKSYGFELPYPIRGHLGRTIRIIINWVLGPLTPPFFRSEFIVHAEKIENNES